MRARDYAYFDAPFLALAHRGGAEYAPNVGRENSLHAFAEAVNLGYHYLETDVHATRDGVLVAFHDDALDRVTDKAGRICDLPFAAVCQARIGGVDPIPTFDELLDSFPDTRINIDIKEPGAVVPLWDAVRSHRAEERVCVGSFSESRIHAFRRLAGRRVATSVGQVGVAWTRFVPASTLLLPSPGTVFQIPVRHPIAGREATLATPTLIRRAHRAGQQVHVWTIDDAAEMNRLIDLGVDGLVSDRIDTLKQVLQARGLWS